jgi:hypothetical protein
MKLSLCDNGGMDNFYIMKNGESCIQITLGWSDLRADGRLRSGKGCIGNDFNQVKSFKPV